LSLNSLLKSINYSGICGVEFKFDADTDEYKLIEINVRPVNTIGLAPACELDIAYRDLSGESVEPVTTWQDNVKWLRLWVDYFAARETRRRDGEPSFIDWVLSVSGKSTDAAFAADEQVQYTLLSLIRRGWQLIGYASPWRFERIPRRCLDSPKYCPYSACHRGVSLHDDHNRSPSSRGLGHCPFTAATGVRIPLGTPP
jgi:hypothetical protein